MRDVNVGDLGAALTDTFSGVVLRPGDRGYDTARRVWNGMVDRRPALIARCRNTPDVCIAVRYAVSRGLPLTVRGGGHNVAGTAVADGAVLVDLSAMRSVRVEPATRTATVDGGCRLGDVDAATTPYGLACPTGVVSLTGIGGLALGGGYGWLARKWGFTCDHIVAAEVVLADGSVVEATGSRHPELLWALRGGGGNFGVVTRFTLRLRPVGEVLLRRWVYPVDQVGSVLAAYRACAEAQPDDSHLVGALSIARAGDSGACAGTPIVTLTGVWLGGPAGATAAWSALAEAGRPLVASTRTLPYASLQSMADDSEPAGRRYYTESCYLSTMDGSVAERLGDGVRASPSPFSVIDFGYLRGAISRVPDDATAFPARDAPYICTASAAWLSPDDDSRNVAWSRETIGRLAPWHHGGFYVNYADAQPPHVVSAVYGEEIFRRLAAVKDRYDPHNVFRSNQNIRSTRGKEV